MTFFGPSSVVGTFFWHSFDIHLTFLTFFWPSVVGTFFWNSFYLPRTFFGLPGPSFDLRFPFLWPSFWICCRTFFRLSFDLYQLVPESGTVASNPVSQAMIFAEIACIYFFYGFVGALESCPDWRSNQCFVKLRKMRHSDKIKGNLTFVRNAFAGLARRWVCVFRNERAKPCPDRRSNLKLATIRAQVCSFMGNVFWYRFFDTSLHVM